MTEVTLGNLPHKVAHSIVKVLVTVTLQPTIEILDCLSSIARIKKPVKPCRYWGGVWGGWPCLRKVGNALDPGFRARASAQYLPRNTQNLFWLIHELSTLGIGNSRDKK